MPKGSENAPTAGGNVKDLLETIKTADQKLEKLEDERSAINADMDAIRKDIKAKGVPLDVFRHARVIRRMEEDDRAEYDQMVALCREALGVPTQAELELG